MSFREGLTADALNQAAEKVLKEQLMPECSVALHSIHDDDILAFIEELCDAKIEGADKNGRLEQHFFIPPAAIPYLIQIGKEGLYKGLCSAF
jgi:hypothetical protein